MGRSQSRETERARTAAWLYPRVLRLQAVVGTGVTRGDLSPETPIRAIFSPMSSPMFLQPRYLRAWIRAPAVESMTTGARAEARTGAQSLHSRHTSPEAWPVPLGDWHRGQKGAGGGWRRRRQGLHTRSAPSSGGILAPQARQPRGRKRSRTSRTAEGAVTDP